LGEKKSKKKSSNEKDCLVWQLPHSKKSSFWGPEIERSQESLFETGKLLLLADTGLEKAREGISLQIVRNEKGPVFSKVDEEYVQLKITNPKTYAPIQGATPSPVSVPAKSRKIL